MQLIILLLFVFFGAVAFMQYTKKVQVNAGAFDELITVIDEAADPAKLIAALTEAVQMIQQGKTDREILAHFGIAE